MCESNDRAADTQRTIAEIAELAGGLAHELRNPLSTVMINLKLLTELLQNEDVSDQDARRRALTKIRGVRHEAERLQTLFDDFLHLTGPCRLMPTPIDLPATVRRLIAFLDPVLAAGGVEVRIEAIDQPIHCLADEQLLRQALLNIILNAQQAMPDGGTLTISIFTDDKWAAVSIRDTGMGIPGEDRERILRPFFSTKAKGTGLGLSITRRIITEHRGTLSINSQPGTGSTFTVRLPAIQCEADGPVVSGTMDRS